MRIRLLALSSCLLPLLALASAVPADAARHRVGGPRGPAKDRVSSDEPAAPSLAAYRLLTVTDLSAGEAVAEGPRAELPIELSDRMARVVGEAESLSLQVRRGEPLGRADELVLSGTVQRARKGNRWARVLVGPLARARLVVDLELSEAASGRLLESGTVKKLWALPGWSGAIRGLSGLEESACREVVRYLEHAGAGATRVPATAEPHAEKRASR